MINVNVTDIKDESGYIDALGKEAAAKAINEAKIRVAEQERTGDIGKTTAEKERDIKVAETQRDRDINVALANKEKEIQIAGANRDENIGKAEAERDTRVKMAEANATAVQGENLSKIEIANSEAARREREAEALKKAMAAEKVQAAKALEEAYLAGEKSGRSPSRKRSCHTKCNDRCCGRYSKTKTHHRSTGSSRTITRESKR